MPANLGWTIIAAGLLTVALGLIALTGGLWWLGRLPGDITLRIGHSRIYFPIVTCIVLSVLFTLAAWAVRLFLR